MSVLDNWTCEPFSHQGTTHDVYRRGEGPAVLVLPEIPGITPRVVQFADRVRSLGCTAVLPSLFGDPGRERSVRYGAATFARLCVSEEMSAWAAGTTTPIVSWLRALAADARNRCGGPGVGVVGMCFTGGYALAMVPEPSVLAPVMAQPSLPLPLTRARRAAVQVSPGDLGAIAARFAADPDLCVLGLRFSADRVVPGERFVRLRRLLGDRFVAVEIDSAPGNPFGLEPSAHSMLTEALVDEPGHPTRDALDQVLALFEQRLLGRAG